MSDDQRDVSRGGVHVTLGAVKVKATAHFQMRLSIQNLFAAAALSRRVRDIEQENLGKPIGPFFGEVLGNATACIFCTVASLEAYANEFFIDRHRHLPDLEPEDADRLWDSLERKPILEKFEKALNLKSAIPLNQGASPWQDIRALIALRNALTHFKPEWENEQETHQRVSDMLRNRFAASPFMSKNHPIFPQRWATRGCTQWAVQSCVEFLKEFDSAAGIQSKIKQFESQIAP